MAFCENEIYNKLAKDDLKEFQSFNVERFSSMSGGGISRTTGFEPDRMEIRQLIKNYKSSMNMHCKGVLIKVSQVWQIY